MPRTHLIAALLVSLLSVAPARVGLAARPDDKALALTMAKTAREALRAGQHALAVQMFSEALKLDPKQPDYLYGLARAEHLSGKVSLAEGHYRRFLSETRGHRAEEKVRVYLSGIVGGRAKASLSRRSWGAALAGFEEAHGINPRSGEWVSQIASVADGATRAGSGSVALRACAALRRMAPEDPAHILRQARAERASGRLDAAQRSYLEVLTVAGGSASARSAKKELGEVVLAKARRASSKPATPESKKAAKPTPATPESKKAAKPAPATPESKKAAKPAVAGAVLSDETSGQGGGWGRPVGWGSAVLGALSAAGGAVLMWQARGDRDDLFGRLDDRNGDGRVDTMPRSSAQGELDSINGRKAVGAALVGGGLAVAAVGVLLVATAPGEGESVALVSPGLGWLRFEVRW